MKRTLYQRIRNLVRTNYKHFFSSYSCENYKKWKQLKGQYAGKRIFLIANGPSLNITPLYLLKDEYMIVFNRFQLMLERLNYIPSFYMIADGVVGSNIREDIKLFIDECQKVFIPDISKGDMVNFSEFVPWSNNVYWMYEEPIRFSHTLPFVSPGHTVIFRAFQVLKYMGFSEIFVVGNDMNYIIHTTTDLLKEETTKGKVNQTIRSKYDDDPNHFDPRYFGKGKIYHQPTSVVVENMLKNLRVVAEEYAKYDIKVINAGYNSKVESFLKQDFYECLGYSKEKIDGLFEDLVKSKGFSSLTEFRNLAVDTDTLWVDDRPIAAVPAALASDMIKSKIFDYIPLGPYEGRIFFIKRNVLNT